MEQAQGGKVKPARILAGSLWGVATLVLLGLLAVIVIGTPGALRPIQALSAAAIVVAAVIAMLQFKRARDQDYRARAAEQSKTHLDQCQLVLERAERILKGHDPEATQPAQSRLLWNETAHQLLLFETLSKEVTEPAHQAVLEAWEAYYRHRFHWLLFADEERLTGLPLHFYAGAKASQEQPVRSEIDPRAIAVVQSFAAYPEGAGDVLEGVDVGERLARSGVGLKTQMGLRGFLCMRGPFGVDIEQAMSERLGRSWSLDPTAEAGPHQDDESWR